MKAIVISAYGAPEVLHVTELPDPVPAPEEVLIRVEAFGLNHAEAYMRAGSWGDVAAVPGIECAGSVEADPRAASPPEPGSWRSSAAWAVPATAVTPSWSRCRPAT
ncbi:alcohol dehydrogenase catalytic domain-containing protein [Streptomyces cirratus]|uniref:alcohol dehydrogenase catalytic domain-containing protein n=1 Tax=Streptomyces cirratus TaxID=68187 RepID=UPI00360645ED